MRGLQKIVIIIVFVEIAKFGITQTSTSNAKPAPPRQVRSQVASQTSQTNSSVPSTAEVESFMKRMFGHDASITWKIADISPTPVPGVSQITVFIGTQPQPQHIFVMPGGNFAVVGNLIPYGADPFADAREKLRKGNGPSRGESSASVTVVEFSDLQCPHCKLAQPVIDHLLAEKPNARLVFQPFPLAMHPWAFKAASYGDCVTQQNPTAFWKFIQGVYDAQESITEANADEKLTAIATAAGVEGARAATCASKPETAAHIQQSIELGKSVDVTGTPTVFINGRKVSAIKDAPFESLKAIVDFEAKQAK